MRDALPARRGARVTMRGLALLAAAMPAVTSAQQQPSAGATDELTQALLRFTFRHEGGNARLVPGRVPDDLAPNFYAPPGTRVLGTIVAGSTAVVLALTETPADSLRAVYARALEPRGWKPWEAWGRGGFVGGLAEAPLMFCRDGANLHISYRRRPMPPHDLQLEYRESPGPCQDRPMGERVEFVRMGEPRFPTLRSPEPPPGRPLQSCYSRSRPRRGGAASIGTLVSTDLQARELLEHYGRQLEASGWSPPNPGATPSTASRTWTQRDSTGVSQVVTLEVTEGTPGSGCYDVRMNVTR